VEPVSFDSDNIYIISGHLQCAAYEIPLNSISARTLNASVDNEICLNDGGFIPSADAGESFSTSDDFISLDSVLWGTNFVESIKLLSSGSDPKLSAEKSIRSSLLKGSQNDFSKIIWKFAYLGKDAAPAKKVLLRLIDPITISVIDVGSPDRPTIDTIGYSRAFFEVYPGAVFYAQGKAYLVENLSINDEFASCRKHTQKYHTSACDMTNINVMKLFDLSKGPGTKNESRSSLFDFGIVEVVRCCVGFKKIDNETGNVLEEIDLALQPLKFETKAVWIDVPSAISKALQDRGIDPASAIHTANHVLQAVASMMCQCNGDIETQHYNQPHNKRLLLYDKRPGGLGFCETILTRQSEAVDKAVSLIESCDCRSGCPGCTFASSCPFYNQRLCKRGGLVLLRLVQKKMKMQVIVEKDNSTKLSGYSPRKSRRELENRSSLLLKNGDGLVISKPWVGELNSSF